VAEPLEQEDTRPVPLTEAGEEGCHHFRNPATCEDCEQEEAEGRYLVTVVDRLGGQVEAALSALGKARSALRELTGDLYDIELVEGLAGDDLLAGIKDAERSLRGAERIIDWRKRLLADGEVPGGQ
jgi:hypothetical protein